MANNKCKECGVTCEKCLSSDHDVHLHVEIENLKQRLLEKENHIVMMETNFLNEANKFPNGEIVALKEELLTWQDKYKRLYEAHRRVQRVNQGLEDKLLKLVDVCETEKNTLTKDVATLSHNLAEANYAIKKLTLDNERYKNDVNLAIQFLQCKQTNFVAHRFDSLPAEVQTQVAVYMNNKRKPNEEKKNPVEPKSIKVPIPTFPPTAMVYSVPKSPKPDRKAEVEPEQPEVDIVSAAIMAKVLEERQKERALAKHCDTCTCAKNLKIIYETSNHNVGCQTGDYKENVCLKCNELMVQPLSTGLQIYKTVDEKFAIPIAEVAQNIVKVQPNNFLTDRSKSGSIKSEKSENINIRIEDDFQEAKNVSENLMDLDDANGKMMHHKLCEQSWPGFEKDVKDVEESDKMESRDTMDVSCEVSKGPRYASMRLQTGSKNILLDNAHGNVAPVLYTRSHCVTGHDHKHRHMSSQTAQKHTPQLETESVSSHDSKRISLISENSAQHHRRVSDWVQITLEADVSSSENSRTEERKFEPKKSDKARYAEMEENVKRFLFGESEFLKTVELGKLKYKSLRENEKTTLKESAEGSRTSSHTETEI